MRGIILRKTTRKRSKSAEAVMMTSPTAAVKSGEVLNLNSNDGFNHAMADKDGTTAIPYLGLIGRIYRHSGNQKTYRVIDIVWNADEDRWSVMYQCVDDAGDLIKGGPVVTRTIRGFFGPRGDVPRFSIVA